MKRARKANAGAFYLAGAAVVWGLFAASRFFVAIPAAGGAVWAFPAWQWPAAAFLSAGILVLGLYARQRRFLAGRGLAAAESARLAALAWLPSFALLVPLAMEAMGGPPGALGLCQEAWPLFALAALGLTAGLTLSQAPAVRSGNRLGKWAGPLALFLALAAFLFCAHQLFRANQAGPLWGGDEPQYLYIAHSLAVDRDLDLYDQIMLRENIYFQTPEDMIGGHGRKSARGVWLSKHMPGLPILLSPFYAWALRLGLNPRWPCSLFMMLCSAWLVWETFALAKSLTGRDGASFGAAALLALCMPLVVFAPSVFPGVAGAALGLACFRRVCHPEAAGGLLAAGLFAAFLPWLNERFILLSLLLGLYFLVKGHWRRASALAAFGLPLVFSAVIMMAYFQAHWGSVLPPVALHAAGSFLNPRGVWQGLAGLLLDGKEGLFIYAPVWLAGLAGLGWLARRFPTEALFGSLFFLAAWLVAGPYAEWWGGLTFPSRYLLAAAPFLALGLGGGLARGGPGFAAAVLALAGASLWASWQALGDVRQAVGTVAGHAPFLGQSLAWPLQNALFPSLVPPGGLRGASAALAGGEASKTVVWSLVSLAGLVGLLLCKKRPKQAGSALALAAVFVLVLLGAGAAGAFSNPGAWRMSPAQKLNLWDRLARTGPKRTVADNPGLDAMVIRLEPSALAHAPARPLKSGEALIPARAPEGPLLWGRYLDLPAGRYRVEVLCRAMDRGNGPLARLDVAARQGRLILAGAEIMSGQEDLVAMALDFELKEPLPRVEVRLGGAGRETAIAGLALRRLL